MNRAERNAVVRVLRAAVDGTAGEVRPEELGPLHLIPRIGVAGHGTAGHEVAGLGAAGKEFVDRGEARVRRRPSRPVAALAAAAAVLAIAGASFGAASALRADRAEMTGAKPAAGPLSLIPRYFVELPHATTGRLRPARRALVIDSTTGKVVASVSVRRPYTSFMAVTAAADDRTFVLAAETLREPNKNGGLRPIRSELLLLRITPRPSGGVSASTDHVGLRIPLNWQGQGLALAPDGTKLAFAASPLTKKVVTTIWVYSMITGATRAWQHRGEIGSAPWDARSLSWSPDDQTLAYLWHNNSEVNLLKTDTAGGDLLAHSRRLISFSLSQHPTFDAALTPDGKKVVASMYARIGGQLNEYSAVTGRLISHRVPAVLDKLKVYDVLWSNNSGSAMILYLNVPPGVPYPVRLLHGNKLISIKGIRPPLNAGDLAW